MKNTKSIIMIVLLFVLLSNAQVMVIHRGHTTDTLSMSSIDSVTFDTTASVMKDIDGNVYKTIKIGNQWWMAENLKVTHYNNGTPIPNITDNDEWQNLTNGAYCWYDNDSTSYAETYGALYNWYAVDDDSIAPSGWHVPTDEEWTELQDYLIANGYNYDGTTEDNKIGKSLASQTYWNSSSDVGDVGNDMASNNASGFNAFPNGYRYYYGSGGSFYHMGSKSYWWSSTEYSSIYTWYCTLYYDKSNFYHSNISKQNGFSVRLIRD